jgi:diguanylate cyclase (GGDEF)-like protein
MNSGEERIEDLREQARVAAAGLAQGEHALVAVLRDMEREQERSADSHRAVVRSLAAALEARDGYTGGHSEEVHTLAVSVALRLGLSPGQVDELRTVALLHDIGKIGIPDQILHKPGKLSDDEWRLMREHPAIGERILRPVPGLSSVATAVRHEHERWDGKGYPDGLAGDAIPLASRVVLACDAWHALVSDRPYRTALPREEALEELRRCSGTQFDPRVVHALLGCLEDPAGAMGTQEGYRPEATGAESRLQAELRALLTLAAEVAAVHSLEDVIETAAEEARIALGAGSLSISKLELDAYQLRTLINVGDLGPDEERSPADEVYPLADYPRLMKMFERMEPHRVRVDDPEGEPSERDLLRTLGKSSSIAVPVVFADRMWGELYATRKVGEPAFEYSDLRFLQAIAGQLAAAIGRAEMFSRMAELAYEDSLTGLANRRALDQRLEQEVAAALRVDGELTLVLCDVDNLKEINDGLGHQAGDAALVRVAQILRAAASGSDRSLVARLGGDEFCLVLPGKTASQARLLIERVLCELVADDPTAPGLSAGIASIGTGERRPADLMRAADGALYTAKRNGRRRVFVARSRDGSAERPVRERRSQPTAQVATDLHRLLGDTLQELDAMPLPALERLSVAMLRVAAVADSRGWAISHAERGSREVRTVHFAETRVHDDQPLWVESADESYAIDDFPATAAIMAAGGSFALHADDPDADPAEVELLREEGRVRSVVAAAAPWAGGCWLVELYGDDASLDPALLEPYVRLLVQEAVRGAMLRQGYAAAAEVSTVDA